jgi:hypothetical protein
MGMAFITSPRYFRLSVRLRLKLTLGSPNHYLVFFLYKRLSSLPQNQGSWHSPIVNDAGCRLTPVMR